MRKWAGRVIMTLDEIRNEQRDYFAAMGENVNRLGICALVDVENMGFCKDRKTRWYFFDNEKGEKAVYFKY